MQRLRQLAFASLECDRKKRKTRREIFPARSPGHVWKPALRRSVPRAAAASAVGDAGRALHSAVLRSGDPAMENLLCEAEGVRRLAGARLEKVPDETTVPTSAVSWSGAGCAPSGGNCRQRRDLTPSGRPLHGEEKQVRADARYREIGKRAFGCEHGSLIS